MNQDDAKIIFDGDPRERKEAIAFINQQLAIHGDLGSACGNYRAGLLDVAGANTVSVVAKPERYDISTYTHDLQFSIDRQSGQVFNSCVGTAIELPEPDFDAYPLRTDADTDTDTSSEIACD